MKPLALLAATAVLALTSAAHAVQAPATPGGAQPAPTLCQLEGAGCSAVLSRLWRS